MVLPDIPTDHKVLWDPALSSGGMGQGTSWAYLQPTSLPWAFRKDYDAAHKLAQEYAKQYSRPYYIADLSVNGRYAPPPPAYEPVYEDFSVWEVPKK